VKYISPDLDISPYFLPKKAQNTSIRTRFKSLTALELNKVEIIKRAAYVVAGAYVREINLEKKALAKNN